MNEELKVTTFDVVMTTTEYHHFENMCGDAANIQIVDLNSVVHAHLITQVSPESISSDTDGINFHIWLYAHSIHSRF